MEVLRQLLVDENHDMERKIYNRVHLVTFTALLAGALLSYFFFGDKVAVFLCFGTAVLCAITCYEANRTKRYEICAYILSVSINFFLFPTLYFMKGHCDSFFILFFVMGLLYTAITVEHVKGNILLIAELVFDVIIVGLKALETDFSTSLAQGEMIGYVGSGIALLLVSIYCGVSVRYRFKMYNIQQKKAEEDHLKAMDTYITKDIFLINMSHEIRTPMNAIVGTVDLLLDQDVNEHVRDSVYNILNSCNALLSLTNELMDLSKSESSDAQVYSSRYDINEMLMEIINMVSVRLMDSDVELCVDITPDLPRYLYGDSAKLRQVFINILNNAVKYTKQGKIILRVYKQDVEKNRIRLCAEVEDTGCGISEEDLKTLFKNQSPKEKEEPDGLTLEGTGMGLVICKDILEKMGGSIRVESQEHIGSRFFFNVVTDIDENTNIVVIPNPEQFYILVYETKEEVLDMIKGIFYSLKIKADYTKEGEQFERLLVPYKYSHVILPCSGYMKHLRAIDRNITKEKLIISSEINQIVSTNKSGYIITRPLHLLNLSAALLNEKSSHVREIVRKGGFVCPKATILVVDDNLTNLNVASGLLKKYEAKVITALSGKECLNILDTQKVDLIFLDYMMPEMNGIDTLERIKQMPNPAMKEIPVIALTANVVNGAKEMFMEAGFDEYISKPIEVDRIERALTKFLKKELIEEKNQ